MLKERGLPCSGKKQELVARLREHGQGAGRGRGGGG